ncbi:PBP1A family penicillin-binding protein [Caulobacter sp. KR2-114]|uniref:transglycosylase domain-containing protein n=1 Tax=Caulobacter sp. KR2-114 TaxID=3400912 RepID=UPI003BFBBDF7
MSDPPAAPPGPGPADQTGARFGRRPASPSRQPSAAGAEPPRPGRRGPGGPSRPRRGAPRWLAVVAVTGLVLLGVAGLGFAWFAQTCLQGIPEIPSQQALWAIRRSPGMTFLDHSGGVIATRGAKYGQAVTLKVLPAYVPRAFLAAEDRRFYQHGAVDLRAIARAARRDLQEHRAAEGASTLTQQLARTLFLKQEHTLRRKVQEAVLASRLEDMLGKDQVLELYLNRTFFGAGAYGLDAASETYFGHPASQLSLTEAALLAAVPNAPSRLALTNDMAGAMVRARKILGVMRDEGWITPAQYAEALSTPPSLAPPRAGEGDYSYILDQAASEASALAQGQSPDLVVRLTIDPKLQAAGLEAVRYGVQTLGRGRRVSQGALVALAPDGAIRAMVGGLDHEKSAFNRVTQARRQPGSSFKAFVYAAAVEHGVGPNDIRQDSPIAIKGWTPENYGGHFSGAVPVRVALARSINTISVRLAQEVGPEAVGELARRFGVTSIPPHPGLSIALGAYEVTLMQMAGGYQVLQNGGGKTTPYLIEDLRSTRGDLIYAHAPTAPALVYDNLFATRMVQMMEGVITGGTGTSANLGRPEAGKTGTSQNWRDAWFIGFTPDMLAGVWVGNDDNSPMAKVTGGEIPAAIWKRFMTVALKDTPPSDFPWLSKEPEPAAQAPPDAESGAGPYLDEPDAGGMTPPPGETAPDDDGYNPYASHSGDGQDGDEDAAPPPGARYAPSDPYANRRPPAPDSYPTAPSEYPRRGGSYYDAGPRTRSAPSDDGQDADAPQSGPYPRPRDPRSRYPADGDTQDDPPPRYRY